MPAGRIATGAGRLISLGRVRAELIVLLSPSSSQYLCLFECGEDLPVQQIVSQFPVEGPDVAILPRTTWFNEQCLHSKATEPPSSGLPLP